MVETKSLIGIAHQTPFIPIEWGRIISNGVRRMTCRISERNIDFFALPIDWKKLEETI